MPGQSLLHADPSASPCAGGLQPACFLPKVERGHGVGRAGKRLAARKLLAGLGRKNLMFHMVILGEIRVPQKWDVGAGGGVLCVCVWGGSL